MIQSISWDLPSSKSPLTYLLAKESHQNELLEAQCLLLLSAVRFWCEMWKRVHGELLYLRWFLKAHPAFWFSLPLSIVSQVQAYQARNAFQNGSDVIHEAALRIGSRPCAGIRAYTEYLDVDYEVAEATFKHHLNHHDSVEFTFFYPSSSKDALRSNSSFTNGQLINHTKPARTLKS